MPLKNGYSYDTVRENIATLRNEGMPAANAVAAAYAKGRVSFFRSYPGGAIPAWLAFPAGYRLREHYNASGAPLRNVNAPRKRNPESRSTQKVTQAARRFSRFTGNTDVSVRKINVSPQDKIVLAVGPCDGILYSTVRDGVGEKYVHRFAKHSRPLLAASHDGKRLYLLGGAYTFTDRGIVDRKR